MTPESSEAKATPCPACHGSMTDPAGVWDVTDGCNLDFCRECCGSGRDLTKPPCGECGALTPDEADKKCKCAGDKDWCHGCQLWPDTEEDARP